MTNLTEFIEKIEELGIKFTTREIHGRDQNYITIRAVDTCECPIVAVANRMFPMANYPNSGYLSAGLRLGLPQHLIYDIALAADDEPCTESQRSVYGVIRGLVQRSVYDAIRGLVKLK